jgi:two-component system OmpR family response regulator
MRVLVVEDEPDLAHGLARALREENFAVDVSLDGEDALLRASDVAYDAIVLDVMLPHRDGWSVLEALRQRGRQMPVLVLTARDAVEDRVRGLNLGADDYLVKPFALSELVARLRALLRRAAGRSSAVLTVGQVTIDTAARRVTRSGAPVDLTAREYAILELLADRQGHVLTRTVIWEHLYSDDADLVSNAVDVHIASLRRKLGADVIATRRGHGYVIETSN